MYHQFLEYATPRLPNWPLLSVVEHALGALEADPALGRLVRAEAIRLNGASQAGPRTAFGRAVADGALVAALDAEPQVRLHGDLFLENMLWRTAEAAAGNSPRLVLIDPVSVAGVMGGPPLFDLVKYESYATGSCRPCDPSGWRWPGSTEATITDIASAGTARSWPRFEGSIGTRAFAAPSKPGTAPSMPRLSPHRRLLQRGDVRQYGWDPAPRPPTQGHAGLQRRRPPPPLTRQEARPLTSAVGAPFLHKPRVRPADR